MSAYKQLSSGTDLFGVTLFTLMVGIIATGALWVVGGFGLLTACFLGGGVAVVVAVVLGVLLRERQPRAPRGAAGPAEQSAVTGEGAGAPPRGARSDPP